jgi:cytochrome P450
MDVIADLAYPLPIIVIAELLGVPPEDHEKIKHWSAALLPSFSPALSAATVARVGDAIDAFNDYFRTLARRRRAEPRDDLMSALIAAREQGDRLSEDELLATCILLAFAGHASTVQLIGNAAVELLRRPDELARLRGDWSLLGGAIEETLRHASPLQLVYRTTIDDVSLGGKTIPKHQMVFVSLAAANRDPEQFPDPDRFDVTRKDNRHVAFGHSIHYCAGAPLARLEGQVAIRTLFERFAGLELRGEPTREPSLLLRGLTSIPVRFAMP